jgi:hypothetical protein
MGVTVSIQGGQKYQKFLDKMAQIAGGVKAGILEGATNKAGGANVASYAVWNEFGVPNITVTPKMRAYMHYNGVHLKKDTTSISIPARPFMRTVAKEKPKTWVSIMVAHIRGRATDPKVWKDALGKAGEQMKSDIQNSIQNGSWVPNAPLTVKWKAERGKSQPDKPLFATGVMFAAVDFQVVDKV